FPDLAVRTTRLIRKGDDHAVLVVNERFLFRFPRCPLYRKAFPDELSMTSVLTRTSPIAIPDYSFVARDRSFGGYRLIPGKELTVARFNRLTSVERHAVLKALAGFLNALHGLSRAALPAYRAKEPWSG